MWRNQTEFAPMIHALGLHRDPGRGRTHIVLKEVKYVPTATKLKNKFRVISCGVFRIKDVLRDMEFIMGLGPGKAQECVDRVFIGRQEQRLDVPFLDLTFGDGLATLSSGATNIDTILGLAYDPDWRKRLNAGTPPGPMTLRSRARDAEHIF
ncbi:MYND-type domain-containing protein [Mycena sanguinolenta]|uniref:MYND-type domain-containing protein n=1 Tax=Mycena sanguinolenta TaxID=230812 RepID=A0A8H6XCE2_9AGAR|nr:MYND-type domain-containing protein [Mycena sanguinolenta]